MVERQAPVMLLDHREGRAEDVFLAQIAARAQTLDEAGLARAQLADQAEQLATLEAARPAAGPHDFVSRVEWLSITNDHASLRRL